MNFLSEIMSYFIIRKNNFQPSMILVFILLLLILNQANHLTSHFLCFHIYYS